MLRKAITTALGLVLSLVAMAQTQPASLDQALRSLGEISTLITQQEHDIVHLQAQLNNIERQQRCINDSITRLKWQLAQLRSQYAQVVRRLNVHSSPIDQLAFIFSAGSLGQVWQRATYLRQLSLWRKSRSIMLYEALARLKRQQTALQRLSNARLSSLNACNNTRAALQSRLDHVATLVATLHSQAPQLGAVLKEKQQRAQQLGQSLDSITTTQQPSTQDVVTTLHLKQGSLAHPTTSRHRITTPYGKQRHPQLQYVTIVNNGIDITCLDTPAQAVAVATGEVSAIYSHGQGYYTVMVRHGQYLSVYTGLSHIVVKKGQRIAEGQPLGEVAIDPTSHKPILHFELRHGSTALDPTLYIKLK